MHSNFSVSYNQGLIYVILQISCRFPLIVLQIIVAKSLTNMIFNFFHSGQTFLEFIHFKHHKICQNFQKRSRDSPLIVESNMRSLNIYHVNSCHSILSFQGKNLRVNRIFFKEAIAFQGALKLQYLCPKNGPRRG